MKCPYCDKQNVKEVTNDMPEEKRTPEGFKPWIKLFCPDCDNSWWE